MAVTFGYEYFKAQPNFLQVGKGLAIPWCSNCHYDALLQAVGIIGAIIMPHNLYLHSALVKSRQIDRNIKEEVKDANRYVFIESAIALGVSLIINIAITAVFAHGLFGKTSGQIHEICLNSHNYADVFLNTTDPVDVDLFKGGVYLGCQFGIAAMYIWAVGIFAAGQSATMTGTYSGQFVMEGFLNLTWVRWKRVVFTRTIAILPTLFVAITQTSDNLTNMNDLLNALMSLQLPFALLPTLTITSSKKIMGHFTNDFVNQTIAIVLSVGIIGINLYFVQDFVQTNFTGNIFVYVGLGIFVTLYLSFLFYLVCYIISFCINLFIFLLSFLYDYHYHSYMIIIILTLSLS